jgi:ABC-type methionine transport system permease subunit
MTTTLKNTALFLLKRPGYSLSLVALCAILTILSILTTLPFIVLLISLLALIGALAVEEEIKD